MFDDLMEKDPKMQRIRAESEARGKAEGEARAHFSVLKRGKKIGRGRWSCDAPLSLTSRLAEGTTIFADKVECLDAFRILHMHTDLVASVGQ